MSQLRLLIVDDSETDALLLLRELKKAGYTPLHRRVDSAEGLEQALAEQEWDVILCDYVMPGFGGPAALKLAQEKGLDIPFIVVSGQIGEAVAVEAMKAGADDYIMKDSLKKLAPAVKRELRDAENRRERKRAEEARQAEHQDRLQAYQRLVNIGRLSGNLAHEMRNPLATIGSSVAYLQKRLPDADDKIKGHLGHIQNAVDRCAGIIQKLLDEARMREAELTELDLRAVVEDILARSAIPDTIQVERRFPDTEVPVKCDAELMGVACHNIIINAVEAMNRVGRLTVDIDTEGNQAVLSFSDTGPGIAPENLSRVFEPLFTTKPTGTGFGLPVAMMAVGKQGGTIEASSAKGQGAVFTLRLLLAKPRPDGSKARP